MAAGSNLQRFKLTGVRETGIELGRGSYATVVEVQFRGLKCAGKKLFHEIYNSVCAKTQLGMLQRLENECALLSDLKHPNIVQFLGVNFEERSQLPTLVMEFLDTTLTTCLDRHHTLPEEISYTILDDIATALCYLHGSDPAIIHRDLTANNILLTSEMRAKISDLGMARILNLNPDMIRQMTQCPGTLSYMAPEALEANPNYSTEIDCFSYGVMLVHIFCGQWPIPDGATRIDPNNPITLLPRNEFERREKYLTNIATGHPLMKLIKKCLSNYAIHRPNAEEIMQCVREEKIKFPPMFENKIAMLEQKRTLDLQLREAVKKSIEHREEYLTELASTRSTYDQYIKNETARASAELAEERASHECTRKNLIEQIESLHTEITDLKNMNDFDSKQYQTHVQKLMVDNAYLNTKLTSTSERKDSQEREFAAVYEILISGSMQKAILESKIDTLDEKLEGKKVEISALHLNTLSIEKELSAKVRELTKRIERLHKEQILRKEEQTAVQDQLEAVKEQHDASIRELEVKTNELELLRREIQESKESQCQLYKQIGGRDKINEAKQLEMDIMKNEMKSLENTVVMKEKVIRSLSEQLKQAQRYVKAKGIPLGCQLMFKFKKCADLPVAMSDCQCVVVGERIYVGGGVTDNQAPSLTGEDLVFEYEQIHDRWSTLPSCQNRLFGLASFAGHLLMIGGISKASGVPCGKVRQFCKETQNWDEGAIPPMPTKRFQHSVVSHGSVLAVCGGIVHGGHPTNIVEVFIKGVWYSAPKLSNRICLAKPVIIDNSCHLIGGHVSLSPDIPSKVIMSIPLSTLFQERETDQHVHHEKWKIESEIEHRIPQYKPASVNYSGTLLVVGGFDQSTQAPTKHILARTTSHIWVNVENLPSARSNCTVSTQLCGGQVMIVGGIGKNAERLSEVLLMSMRL